MANINDFKILNEKCRKYFALLENELRKEFPKLSDKTKERFGFYIFMLESLCDIKDPLDIIELITDTEFNSEVFGIREEDLGIDAIFINDEQNIISLFNFKFREKFNLDKKQSINETLLSTKFTNALIQEDTSHISGKLKDKADEIIGCFNSKDIWRLKLFVVSNEAVELDVKSSEIKQLQELYGLEVIPVGLDTISREMSIRPQPIDAVLHLGKDAIMPFAENSLSSSKSYLLRISAAELIRITCDKEELRNKYSIEDLSPLSKVNMEYNLLFDNVRGLVIKSKFNDNIYNTLKYEPSKFFMYNNGLTVTATDIITEDTNANKRVKITLRDFQVVNGGQTLRTLHKFNKEDENNVVKYLSNCEILLRVFKTTSQDNVKNKIAEYTNSQNAISIIDLKSLSTEQIQIEQFLDEHNIIYARKAGDTGLSKTKLYDHKISMEKFGQILFSIRGNPEKASNLKRQIFDKYYSEIFGIDNFDISKSVSYIKRYFDVKNTYDNNTKGYESTEQKVFYILYLDSVLNEETLKEIDLLESAIKEFKSTGKELQDSRKLIQTKFKDFLEERIQTSNKVTAGANR